MLFGYPRLLGIVFMFYTFGIGTHGKTLAVSISKTLNSDAWAGLRPSGSAHHSPKQSKAKVMLQEGYAWHDKTHQTQVL